MAVQLCNVRCESVNETFLVDVLRSERLFGIAEYFNTILGRFHIWPKYSNLDPGSLLWKRGSL